MDLQVLIERASVVSISGEDHGLKSISKWTKAVKAVTASKEDDRIEEKRLDIDNHHPQTMIDIISLTELIFMINS